MPRKKPGLFSRPESSYIWIRYYDEQDRLIRRSKLSQIAMQASQRVRQCERSLTFRPPLEVLVAAI